MFIVNVSTNSSEPDREDRLVAEDALRRSPVPAAAMNAVIVCIASPGLKARFGVPPAAISTIIVSPTARETPSTNDATMPESAAGTHDPGRDL